MNPNPPEAQTTAGAGTCVEDNQGGDVFTYDCDEARLPSSASHIRLLVLHPSSIDVSDGGTDAAHFASRIRCDLRTASITAPPLFNALSYCWGTGDATYSIEVGGARLAVTESLGLALRHIRRRDDAVVLWIDQICINQADAAEKADQVRMMARIYSQAEKVLVWLGPAAQGSDDVMDLYAALGRAAIDVGLPDYFTKEKYPVLLALLAERNMADPEWEKLSRVIDAAMEQTVPCLQALVEFDKREWFRRVWVVQEFCLGADSWFVCGNKSVPADSIKFARLLMGNGASSSFYKSLSEDQSTLLQTINHEDPSPTFFSARIQRQKYERGDGPGDTMLDVLRKVYVDRDANATLAQDRIFSLVGLAVDADQLGIQIDYTKPALPVLADAARAIIEGGDLGILSYAQFPKDHLGLPSWVPDWRPTLQASFYPWPRRNLNEDHFFAPSGNHAPVVLPTPDDDSKNNNNNNNNNSNTTLGLSGIHVDTVEDVGSVWADEGSDPQRHQACISQVRLMCRLSAAKNQPIYASDARRAEAVWRVPIGDIYNDTRRAGAISLRAGSGAGKAFADLAVFHAWHEDWKLAQSREEFKAGMAAQSDARDAGMYRLSMAKMKGMRPFVTGKGYVGMGPSMTCAGDEVVIFFGARVASVLRRRGGEEVTEGFLYLGEAYCDGVMDGELLGRREERAFFMN